MRQRLIDPTARLCPKLNLGFSSSKISIFYSEVETKGFLLIGLLISPFYLRLAKRSESLAGYFGFHFGEMVFCPKFACFAFEFAGL